MAVPDWCGIYLKLSRATWLSERISMFPPIQLFSIFSITQALLVYISTWTTVVWSPMHAVPPSQASSVHLSTRAFIGLRPLCVPDQSFDVWFESILPFTSARELACEWLVVRISWCYPVCPHVQDGFILFVPGFFTIANVCQFWFSLLAAVNTGMKLYNKLLGQLKFRKNTAIYDGGEIFSFTTYMSTLNNL